MRSSNLPNNWISVPESVPINFSDLGSLVLAAAGAIISIPFFLYLRKTLKYGSKEDYIKTSLDVFNMPHKQLFHLVAKASEPIRRSAIKIFEEKRENYLFCAFLFGTGHSPYLEKYLLKEGYRQIEKDWLIAVRNDNHK